MAVEWHVRRNFLTHVQLMLNTRAQEREAETGCIVKYGAPILTTLGVNHPKGANDGKCVITDSSSRPVVII